MLTKVGIGIMGLGWGLESWNMLGIDKIGWELEWISTKEEVGIGIQWMLGW